MTNEDQAAKKLAELFLATTGRIVPMQDLQEFVGFIIRAARENGTATLALDEKPVAVFTTTDAEPGLVDEPQESASEGIMDKVKNAITGKGKKGVKP